MANAMSFGHRLEELTDGVTVFQGGVGRPMPLSATSIDVEITAGLALVVTTRAFTNLEDVPIEAVLTMPVGFDAVVTGFSATIDGRRLSATSTDKGAARERYETAIDDGKMAVLHEETLRGIHVLSVGHLPPGKKVEVELRMVLPLAMTADGIFLRLPMTAGQLYGNTPLQPADDLITDRSVRHLAKLVIRTTSGRAVLSGVGRVELGSAIEVHLDKAIEILLPDGHFGTVLGVSAPGVQVRLELSPASVHTAAINTAVLIDRSGSTSEHIGDGQQTVLLAMRSGLADVFAELKDEDRVELWQFGSDCEHLGTDKGPRVARLLARLDQPDGGTNLKDAIQQVAASGIHDIVVLTDGQTWEALPPLSAELDIRVSAILVGKASLDANIGHLCAMTGGNLFYTPQADVASSARLALNSMRMPHNTRRIETENGQPIKVSRTFGAVEIAATWEDQPQTGEGNKDYGAFAAGLCIGLLNEADTKTLALQEGLCTHLTSLVLIDDCGEVSFGVSETRKIPLMSEQAVYHASRRPRADDSGVRFMMRERRSPEAEELLRKRRAEKRKAIDDYLARVVSKIDWDGLSNRFLLGDISGLGITEQAVLTALKQHHGITKVIAKSQIEPKVFLLAWLATRYAIESTQAQRFSRKVLKDESAKQLLADVSRLVFEAPRLTNWSE